MVTIFVHRNGRTEQVTSIDRGWLNPAAGVVVWVDLAAPSIPESLILSDTFAFHPLSVEDAMSALQFPKVEAYDGYLYIILHGIAYQAHERCFDTHDIDFFLGQTYLVTVHDGHSMSIADLREHATRNPKILSDGPVALLHRVVDAMVDRYRPEVDKLEDRLDDLEKAIFEDPKPALAKAILDEKRQVARLRRIITPQRDVIARLARRDFVDISTEMSFRFRDIYESSRARRRRCDHVSGSDHGHARRASVEREQPAQRGDEGADRRRDDFHAAHAADGYLGNERTAAALSGQPGRAVLVGVRHHDRGGDRDADGLPAQAVDLNATTVARLKGSRYDVESSCSARLSAERGVT